MSRMYTSFGRATNYKSNKINGMSPLDRKVKRNPKYDKVRSTLDTGASISKVDIITTRAYLNRRAELFKRVSAPTVAELMDEHSPTRASRYLTLVACTTTFRETLAAPAPTSPQATGLSGFGVDTPRPRPRAASSAPSWLTPTTTRPALRTGQQAAVHRAGRARAPRVLPVPDRARDTFRRTI